MIEWTNMVMPDILVKAIWRKTLASSGLSPPPPPATTAVNDDEDDYDQS